MYKVMMSFDNGNSWYEYGRYEDQNKANEVAIQVRNERECWVSVECA